MALGVTCCPKVGLKAGQSAPFCTFFARATNRIVTDLARPDSVRRLSQSFAKA
jgi:hypothetical protein